MYVHLWSVCGILSFKSHCSFTELELCPHAHGGAAENTKISPPELSIYFTSCFTYLKNPIKSYNKGTGIVYFSSMEDEQGNKIKITLMRCFKDHDGPGGALSVAKDAISLLKQTSLHMIYLILLFPKYPYNCALCVSQHSDPLK